MQSNIFKPLPFLPARHHLNRWAFGYYLVKSGFSTWIVQSETAFSYKQIRKIRDDLGIREHRRSCYGQDIISGSDWIKFSAGVHVYCELRVRMEHIQAVVEAYDWTTRKNTDRTKRYDISGFYVACQELYCGEAIFTECQHCQIEVFAGPGLRDRLIGSRCPGCGTQHWERPARLHRVGHIGGSSLQQQQSLF